MQSPVVTFPSPFTVLNDSRADTHLIRPILDSLASKFCSADQKIVDRFVVSHFSSVGRKAYQILPRILEIIDENHLVFNSSGLARTLLSNVRNIDGAPGLVHELELFHLVEKSKHRRTPTLIRSKINGQEVDVRTRFIDGVDVLFEAKLGGTRGNQSQFHRLVHAAMDMGAKLVYVSASERVHDDGILSLSDLKSMIDQAHPGLIAERFNLAHETNLSEFRRDCQELLSKPKSNARIRTRIEASRYARRMLKNQVNRDNVALLDNELLALSCEDAAHLWTWIAADPKQADQRFELLYDEGLARLIIEDFSGELLKSVLNS